MKNNCAEKITHYLFLICLLNYSTEAL